MGALETSPRGPWVPSLLLTVLFLTPTALAVAQDDGGTGGDAPSDPFAAPTVPVGPIDGQLVPEEGDQEDWYRVEADPSKGIRVTLTSDTGGLALEIMHENGWFLDSACCTGGPGAGIDLFTSGAPAYRILVQACCEGGPYHLDMELVDLADLAIEDVTIHHRPVSIDTGPTPLSTQRTVDVTVRNIGNGNALMASVGASVRHDLTSGQRSIGGDELPDLGPGEAAALSFDWDATGEVGDVTVVVDVFTPLDASFENNHAEVRDSVLVGGIGTSADVVGHQFDSCDETGCLNAMTGWFDWGKGAWLDWHSFDGSRSVHLHAGTHPGEIHVDFDGRYPGVGSWWIDVGTGPFREAHICLEATTPECIEPSVGGPP